MRNEKTNLTILIAGLLVLGVIMAMTAVADPDPSAPNVLTATHDRRTGFATTQTADAYSGNVSQLTIDHERLTRGWQGYYGQVSGVIVLDDNQNQSIYTWNLTTAGEVYATWNATTPGWSSLLCLNSTTGVTEQSRLNLNATVVDNFTNTFYKFNDHPGFNVSTKGFEPDLCNYTLSTYVSDAVGAEAFNETVLWDATSNFTVYMALLNPDATGFNGSTWDFQMLVPEDGWNDNTVSTTYYFYLELQ